MSGNAHRNEGYLIFACCYSLHSQQPSCQKKYLGSVIIKKFNRNQLHERSALQQAGFLIIGILEARSPQLSADPNDPSSQLLHYRPEHPEKSLTRPLFPI